MFKKNRCKWKIRVCRFNNRSMLIVCCKTSVFFLIETKTNETIIFVLYTQLSNCGAFGGRLKILSAFKINSKCSFECGGHLKRNTLCLLRLESAPFYKRRISRESWVLKYDGTILNCEKALLRVPYKIRWKAKNVFLHVYSFCEV